MMPTIENVLAERDRAALAKTKDFRLLIKAKKDIYEYTICFWFDGTFYRDEQYDDTPLRCYARAIVFLLEVTK